MLRATRLAPLFVLALMSLAAPAAQAGEKTIYSYDSMSKSAKDLTGAGLTFIFRKGILNVRVQEIRATGVPVGVKVSRLGDGRIVRGIDEALGANAGQGDLYEIDPKAMQGAVMIKAFCPGSTRVWLAVGPLARGDLRVQALGDNPQTGAPHLCATMDFAWRGEWKLPKPDGRGDPNAIFKPDYGAPSH